MDLLPDFALGLFIGFVLGYITRLLQNIKKEVDEVVEEVVVEHPKDDRGGFSREAASNVAMGLVMLLAAWAAFSSQKASNDMENTQERLARISVCNQNYLSRTITALNERTEYSQSQATANIRLQEAQAKFIGVVVRQPNDTQDQLKFLDSYFNALNRYITIASASRSKSMTYAYPTAEDL